MLSSKITNRTLQFLLSNSIATKRRIHTSSNLLFIYERKKSGYPTIYDNPPEKKNLGLFGQLREGCRVIKEELKLFGQEAIEAIKMDHCDITHDHDSIQWQFDGTQKSRNQWVVSCDSDYKLGFSTAKLELSPSGTGVFSGVLDKRIPRDGTQKRAGYANITTVPKRKSFKRKLDIDWTGYTHLVLRIRGDGRCYAVNLLTKGYFDLTWNDMYQYVLYTRGGPYWQYVKIPFSKFVFVSKGIVQDDQGSVPLAGITNFGITVSGDVPGPFRLEIDYVALTQCDYEFEDFAYEMYKTDDIKW